MKFLVSFCLTLLLLLCFFFAKRGDGYKGMRFSTTGDKETKNISGELGELSSINQELINNEKEESEEEEDDNTDEDEEKETKKDFDEKAEQALEEAEEQGIVDLENAEIDDMLDIEIFKIIQERLKKLWYIGKCRRNYSALCPLNWKRSAYDENLCVPPETYEGQCRSLDFSNTTEKEKESFAWRCEVEWPCISAPKIKPMGKCPLRWTNVGADLCIAPEDYVGQCPPAIDFSKLNFEMRVRLAIQCDFEWPVEPIKENVLKYNRLHNAYGGPVEETGSVKLIKN